MDFVILGAIVLFVFVAWAVRRHVVQLCKRTEALQREVAKRKQTEEMLQKERAFTESLVNTAQNIILELDTEGRIVRFNPYMEEISGYRLDEVRGKDWFDMFIPKHDRERIRKIFSTAINGIRTRGNINTIVNKDGQEREIEWYDKTLKDGRGNTIGLLAIGQNVTERKRADEEIRESEARFRDMALSTSDWVWEVDAEGRFTYCSEKVFDIMGYTVEEMLGKTPFDFMLREEAARVGNIFSKVAADKKPIKDLENQNITKDGHEIIILTNGVPRLDGEGNLLGYRGVDKDITERKRADIQLLRSETKYRALYDSTSEAVMLLDEKGFFDCNDATVRIFGCKDKAEFCSKHPADMSPATQPCGTHSMTLANRRIATALEKGSHRFEWMHKRLDTDEAFPAEVLLNALELDGRTVLQAVVCDITERKRSEKQIQDYAATLKSNNLALEKLNQAAEAANRAKSEFLANMSHEIRTPLTAILGFADILMGSEMDREQLDAVTTIMRNGKYLIGIINGILDLSKIEAGKLEVERIQCSPCQVLSEIVSLMRVRAGAKNLPLEIEYHGLIPQSRMALKFC